MRCQPKGVVGVISPWNFPVNLTFTPLAGILAAGNRAMIKPSEYTPATSALMAQMFGGAFSAEEIAVVTGGPAITGFPPDLRTLPTGCSFAPRCPIGRDLPQCHEQTPLPHLVSGPGGDASVECHFAEQRIAEVIFVSRVEIHVVRLVRNMLARETDRAHTVIPVDGSLLPLRTPARFRRRRRQIAKTRDRLGA